MNKKQLIVAWVMGILIALSFMFMPFRIYFREPIYTKFHLIPIEKGKPLTFDDIPTKKPIGYKIGIFVQKELHPVKVTYRLLGRIFPFLIIGGLLIYTLRNKR